MPAEEPSSGHVFLSYVREDAEAIDRLQADLEAAGLRVWRDTQDLWPGDDWRQKIREAINGDALVFLACFSTASAARDRSYQNEELVVAIEAFRQRRPDEPWLIPIRLDECTVTDREIGAGRMLSSLQRVDVFGEGGRRGMSRLVATIVRLLGRSATTAELPLQTSVVERLKAMLPLPERDIALEDLVTAEVDRCLDQLNDPLRFPTALPIAGTDIDRFVLDQAHRYLETTQPLTELLITGCAYGSERHNRLWRSVIEALGSTLVVASGHREMLDLRRLALLPALFGASISAVSREKWAAFAAVTTQPRLRNDHKERTNAVGDAHVWLPFSSIAPLASAFALEIAKGGQVDQSQLEGLKRGSVGRRLMPVSDALHDYLRPLLRPLIRNDADFDDAFDETEVLLSLSAAASAEEARRRGAYQHGAWYGSWIWRRRWDAAFELHTWQERRTALEAANTSTLSGADWDTVAAAFFEGATRARQER